MSLCLSLLQLAVHYDPKVDLNNRRGYTIEPGPGGKVSTRSNFPGMNAPLL